MALSDDTTIGIGLALGADIKGQVIKLLLLLLKAQGRTHRKL